MDSQTPVVSSAIRAELDQARSRTDELFAVVRPDSLFERPVPERHRLNFYIGHLEAFDWNMICDYQLSLPALNKEFNELYAFGIDPDESGLPGDQPRDWPTLRQTADYCRKVRETVDRVIGDVPEDVAQVCIEHRLMHAETLCYLIHNLDETHKAAPGPDAVPRGHNGTLQPAPRWIEIPAGSATLGRPRGNGFGWDNEFEELRIDVPAFSVTKHKVTNGEYLRFVQQGGEAPHYWRRSDNEWRLQAMFGSIPLPMDWPVYVTRPQALEYTESVGGKLPAEAQLDRAGYGSPEGKPRAYPWGDAAPDARRGAFDFNRWDPLAVTATPDGDSAFGVSQVVGNGWEWTNDQFRPLPGFKEYPFYPGYSADFFDDDHFVIKGGSPRTAAKLLRRSFRNWFRGGYPYVYGGFRLVKE